jgi:palmitoyltransferase ZDHHC2/15/20
VNVAESRQDAAMYTQGVIQTVVFNVLCFMVLVCFTLAVVTPPGSIPNTTEWIYIENDQREQPEPIQTALETKKSGQRRNCKWCGKYKPDRCHHCRVCRTCVLKMDHHCPWIYNCVGIRNHKFFFLLLLYSTATCVFVAVTNAYSVLDVVSRDDPELNDLFLVLFGECLSGILGLVTLGFFGFHLYLTVKAITTIEFCEKQTGRNSSEQSLFDKGVFGNFQEILGRNPLWWLLPFHPDRRDGLTFVKQGGEKSRPTQKGDDSDSPVRHNDGGTGGGASIDEERSLLLQDNN